MVKARTSSKLMEVVGSTIGKGNTLDERFTSMHRQDYEAGI
jgi:hypothetical protein